MLRRGSPTLLTNESRDRHAIVAESRVLHRAGLLSILATLLLGWPKQAFAATAETWPFTLPGPQFLEFYVLLIAAALLVALVLRWYLRQPAPPLSRSETFDSYETAYLARGPAGAFAAALVGAAQRQLVEVRNGKVTRTAAALPPNLPLVERSVCAAAQAHGTRMPEVRAATRDALEMIAAGLAERGVVMSDAGARSARITPALVMAAVLFIGAIKLKIGWALGRPVGFLVVLLIVVFVLGLVFLFRRPRLTRRGSAALASLRAQHRPLVSTNRAALQGGEAAALLPLAVGLFGVSALHGTPLQDMRKQLKPLTDGTGSTGSGGCASSCGGGGADGGGGGGCGGCGGGGGD